MAEKSKVDCTDIIGALHQFSQTSKFRRHCLEMMAWSLSNKEYANVRQYFLSIDTDKNGSISLGELKKVIEASYTFVDDDASRIFHALDSNNDDVIHYSDFLAAMVNTRINMHDDLLWNAFHRFDTDNSGFITAANMRHVLGEDISTMVSEQDLLKDGKLSYAGFMSYLRGDPKEKHAQAAENLLSREMSSCTNSIKKCPSLKAKTTTQCECFPWCTIL